MELNNDPDDLLVLGFENLKIRSLFTPEIVKSNSIVADILESLANKRVDDYLAVLNKDDSGPLKNGNNSDSKDTVEDNSKPKERQLHIYWGTVIIASLLHLATLYGIYLGFTTAKLATILFAFLNGYLGIFGTTAGSHRLWSHRSYKATWQLKCILLFGQTLAYQNSVIHWSREHRTHHKFSDTDSDPHNAKRGFFFSHFGWLCCKKLDDVIEKGKTIDMSDLFEDKLLRWQHQYYWTAMLIICYLIPTSIPILSWNETFVEAFLVNIARHIIALHVAMTINSLAHLWGSKPYDKSILPSNNLFLTIITLGEGWHNYHHAFPMDYKASEFGNYNPTTTLINFFARLGWAYDLKTIPTDIVKNKIERTGDGSHNMVFERPRSDFKG